MAVMHKQLDVSGVIVEGTIRDLDGIREVGLPIFAWGVVPGHGLFCPVRIGTPITVGQLRIHPRDLIMADNNGCLRVPLEQAEETLDAVQSVIDLEEDKRQFASSRDFSAEEASIRFGFK